MYFLFDLDGCVLDTQTPLHATAEAVTLKEIGIEINPAGISERFAGIPTATVFKTLAPNHDPKILSQRKWEIIKEMIERTDFSQLDLLGETCAMLKQEGHVLAIASASPKWYIKRVLSKTKIFDTPLSTYYDALVSAEEVAKPKPHPDVFLEAMRQIGGTPETSIIIGDGSSDIKAAISADIDAVYFSENSEFDENDRVVRFTEISKVSHYLMQLAKK